MREKAAIFQNQDEPFELIQWAATIGKMVHLSFNREDITM
jgi:hypothetical protein